MNSTLDPLSRLAILHGTDKFGYHDYTPNYHAVLGHLRDQPIKLLEIGVGGYGDPDRGGESLAVWRDYFPNAEVIVGMDIQEKKLDLGPRVKIRQGSQVDEDFLKQLCAEFGPFDVIIDDGSHRNEHVVESFRLLYPGLTDGGIYIAEDVQTSFHPRFGGSLELTSPNSVGHFAELMLDSAAQPIARIDRFHNIFAIHKTPGKAKAKGTPRSPASLWSDPRMAAALSDKKNKVAASSRALAQEGTKVALANHKKSAKSFSDKANKSDPKGTCGAVLATPEDAQTEEALQRLWAMAEPMGLVAVVGNEGRPGSDLLRQLIAQIDHKEIEVHFPEAPILSVAPVTYSIHAYPDGLLFELGENTYPSNFRWTAEHARTEAAIAQMEHVLQDGDASEKGLLQFADILHRHRSPADAFPVLERLQQKTCKERRYFQMMGQHVQATGDTEGALKVYSEALETFPNDPQFAANVASCHLRLGNENAAEGVLRGVLNANDRARAPMVMLSKILERRGDLAEALALAERSINLFPKGQRLTRLQDLARLAERADDPDAEAAAQRRISAL